MSVKDRGKNLIFYAIDIAPLTPSLLFLLENS